MIIRVLAPMRSFAYGLTLPFRSASLILRQPSLLLLSAAPVLITLGLYFWITRTLGEVARTWVLHEITAFGLNPHGVVAVITLSLTRLILILVGALTFSMVAGLISLPFNDFLAERAEAFTDPLLVPAPKPTLRDRLALMTLDLGKTFAVGVALLFTILFSWVPVLNIFAVPIAFLLLALQYLSYPQTRRRQGLGSALADLAHDPFAALGFGIAFTAVFAIPIVSFVGIPLAVVSGTLLYGFISQKPRRTKCTSRVQAEVSAHPAKHPE